MTGLMRKSSLGAEPSPCRSDTIAAKALFSFRSKSGTRLVMTTTGPQEMQAANLQLSDSRRQKFFKTRVHSPNITGRGKPQFTIA